MKDKILLLTAVLTFPIFFGCTSIKPLSSQENSGKVFSTDTVNSLLKHQVFLLGGTGNGALSASPLPDFLSQELVLAGRESSVVFLGNIIKGGLPMHSPSKRQKTLSNFLVIEKMLYDYTGEIIFLPGFEDWEDGAKTGRGMLEQQRGYIEEQLVGKKLSLPCHQCPGPKAIKINKDIIVIAMDTQWWLQPKGRNAGKKECDINTEEEFLLELQILLEEYDDKEIIIAGHHALFSAGVRGGYYPAKYHLFPFTTLNKNLWVPLPGIGSIYPFARRALGPKQDLANVRYAQMIDRLEKIFKQYPNIIYASGNEESLQYFNENKNQQHYVVSGSATKAEYVTKMSGAEFTQSSVGYFKINYYENGAVWLEAWSFSGNDKKEAEVVFRKEIEPPILKEYELIPAFMPKDSTLIIADTRYDRNDFLSNVLVGENYRKEWLTPLTVPVIDFEKEKFTPIKLGGGVQTKSLRVERPDGTQYVLRSVQKDVTKKLPRILQRTFVRTWMQDAITATHPYPSLVIPELSAAVGVNYAIPKLGYVPSSKELGRFNQSFAGTLVLWEGRPKGDMSSFPNFGSAEDIESTPDILQKTRKNLKNKVDEKSMIRSRLFDVFIGDIDRHDDQWRWAEYKQEKGGTIYRPIPRDRDFAFPKTDGILLKIAGYKWAFRQAQGYGGDIRDIAGLALHGKYIDRTFITQSSRSEWRSIAEDMQNKLTDEVIEKAIKSWPEPIYKIHGKELATLMKIRRDKLPMHAEQLYEVNAKQVDVLGSDKRDFFEINRLNDTTTNVKIFGLNKKGEKKELFYQRDFYSDETKEISLYGFAQDDIFEFKGNADKGLRIRAIGGIGEDVFIDSFAREKRKEKKLGFTIIKKNTTITKGSETKDFTSNKETVNYYDRFEHKYPKPLPIVVLGFNRDDIVYIGGGYSLRKYSFRKKPYSFKQSAKLYYSFSNAFALSYYGDFRQIAESLNLDIDTYFLGPNYKSQYFGTGNETVMLNFENKDYYSADYDDFWFAPNLYLDTKISKP